MLHLELFLVSKRLKRLAYGRTLYIPGLDECDTKIHGVLLGQILILLFFYCIYKWKEGTSEELERY